MVSYRITKFNPQKRNDDGSYMDSSEWTAISDIGKPKFNNPTYEEYEKIETAYVDTVKIILNEMNVDFLKVDSIELYDTKKDFKKHEKNGRLKNIIVDFDKEVKILKNGLKLDLIQLDKIIRLILRETVWMLLVNENIEIRFGFDYYMYIKCFDIKPSTIAHIEKSGLFVEANIEQRQFIIKSEV